MNSVVIEKGKNRPWILEVSSSHLVLTPKDDPDGKTYSFERDLFYHEVIFERFGSSSVLIAKCPKSTIFEIPSQSASEINEIIGKPSKKHLKQALKSQSGKLYIGCGLFLVVISLPVPGLQFDPLTAFLGLCFIGCAIASRYFIHPNMILLSMVIPVLVIALSIYDKITGLPSLFGWWIIPIMGLSIYGGLKTYRRFKNTDLAT